MKREYLKIRIMCFIQLRNQIEHHLNKSRCVKCFLLKDEESDSWRRFSVFIIILKEEEEAADGGETGVAQSYKRLTSTS